MPSSDGTYWTTDESLFLSLEGGKEVADWFGFVPSFHDATLDRLELANGNGALTLKAFRMTDKVDANGYFVLDRRANVDIILSGISGLRLYGDATSIIQELGFRRFTASNDEWETVNGPMPGDIEIRWESNYGLEGSVFAREVRFGLRPT